MQVDMTDFNKKIKDTMFFNIIEKYNKVLEELNKEEEKVKDVIKISRGHRELTCLRCNSNHKIKELVHIQTYWHVPPHGCTGGDYEVAQEGYFICPDCNIRNRLLSSNEYSIDHDERNSTKNHLVRFNRYYKSEFKERIRETNAHEILPFVNLSIGKDFIVEE